MEKRLALTQHIREQLADVECALDKLGKGTYGLCDLCGKLIPFARLETFLRQPFVWTVKCLRLRMVKPGGQRAPTLPAFQECSS